MINTNFWYIRYKGKIIEQTNYLSEFRSQCKLIEEEFDYEIADRVIEMLEEAKWPGNVEFKVLYELAKDDNLNGLIMYVRKKRILDNIPGIDIKDD